MVVLRSLGRDMKSQDDRDDDLLLGARAMRRGRRHNRHRGRYRLDATLQPVPSMNAILDLLCFRSSDQHIIS
jgi:hypothetical protein